MLEVCSKGIEGVKIDQKGGFGAMERWRDDRQEDDWEDHFGADE